MPPAPLVDPAAIDTSRVLVDREGIGRCNPQRFEMEQLTAIVHLDLENKLVIGYKDVKPDEFWVRGHMPDYPLMPGVLICEAAAQLSSFFCNASPAAQGRIHRFRRHGGRAVPRPGPARRSARARCQGRAAPPPAHDVRLSGFRRHQHGLPRQDHRRSLHRTRRSRQPS